MRSDDPWGPEANTGIDDFEVAEFVGIGDMPAVPGEEIIDPIAGRQREVEGVPHRWSWHDLAALVRVGHFYHLGGYGQERKIGCQFQAGVARCIGPFRELVQDNCRDEALI